MTRNGRREELRFNVIPMDFCPRCPIAARLDDVHYGMPVALAGPLNDRIIRYVCPSCRLVWDSSWDVAALARFFPSYGPFSDTFIRDHERLEAHRREDIELPAGPRSAFVRAKERQRASL